MTIQTFFSAIQSIADIVQSFTWFFLLLIVYLGIKNIINEIKKMGSNIGENVPKWMDKWDELKMQNRRLDNALTARPVIVPVKTEVKKDDNLAS